MERGMLELLVQMLRREEFISLRVDVLWALKNSESAPNFVVQL